MNPLEDKNNIAKLNDNLSKITSEETVLISTIDVFTEDAYGKNRLDFENSIKNWNDYLKIKLPYNALNENTGFRKALEATKGCTLTHSIGKSDKTKTVLTQSEFCSRLTKLRDNGKL